MLPTSRKKKGRREGEGCVRLKDSWLSDLQNDKGLHGVDLAVRDAETMLSQCRLEKGQLFWPNSNIDETSPKTRKKVGNRLPVEAIPEDHPCPPLAPNTKKRSEPITTCARTSGEQSDRIKRVRRN